MILGFALVLTLLQIGVSFAQPLNQANLNDLEQSVDNLQNYFQKVRATNFNQHEIASQVQYRPSGHPATTNPQLQATSQYVYIRDRNSGLVLEYKPFSDYEVKIEDYDSANIYQQWNVIPCDGFPEYYYIANSADPSKVIAADEKRTPLYLEPMHSGLPRQLNQLWMFRPPDRSNPSNPFFNVMNVNTGLVMNVQGALTDPGTRVQVFSRNPGNNEQFYFF